MNGSNMRDKARAIFGKTFFENTKEQAPAKNAAVALQKRANARPIPTYKVGGVVKKQAGGALTAAEKARAEAMIRQRGDAAMRDPLVMRFLDAQNRGRMSVPGVGPKAAVKRAEGGSIEAQRLEARANAGRYKKGGKAKDGLAAMPTKKASGGKAADRGPTTQGQANAAVLRMQGVATKVAPKGSTPEQMSAMVNKMSADQGGRKAVGVTAYDDRPAERSSAKQTLNALKKQIEAERINPKIEGRPMPAPVEPRPVPMPPPPPPPPPVRVVKKGGAVTKPVKRAVGGAGKTRKGMC